ncbi:MAG: N-acetylmuramoyl-L-alanine amidase [Pseudomonadota bacterium]
MKIKNNRLVDDSGKMVEWVSSPNHSGKLIDNGRPTTLVMHYTAGGPASRTVDYFKKSSAQASAHLVIGRDGEITQMIKLDTIAWHAGKSRWKGRDRVNRFSIGIELANYGKLKQTQSGDWVSWSGQTVPSNRVVVDDHKHFPGKQYGWEIFDPEQMDAVIAAAQAIVSEYNLDPWDLVGHEDISIHRKIDPGPAFAMDKFRTMVFGREEDTWNEFKYRVDSHSGLNLRTEPSVSGRLIENLSDGTEVHVIENIGNWWLVCKVINGDEDVTGYVHRNWLTPG